MIWLVLYPNGKIYYEGVSEADCEANCPQNRGFTVRAFTEEAFVATFPTFHYSKPF